MPHSHASAITRRLIFLSISSIACMQPGESRAQPADHADACLIVSEILQSEIIDSESMTAGLRDGRTVKIELDSGCPQLAYHGSYSYGATNGRLCPGRDYVIARSGEFCRILSIHPIVADDNPQSQN